jgi:hypothetical protein
MTPNKRVSVWVGGIARGIGILVFWVVVAGSIGIALALLFPGLRGRLPFVFR